MPPQRSSNPKDVGEDMYENDSADDKSDNEDAQHQQEHEAANTSEDDVHHVATSSPKTDDDQFDFLPSDLPQRLGIVMPETTAPIPPTRRRKHDEGKQQEDTMETPTPTDPVPQKRPKQDLPEVLQTGNIFYITYPLAISILHNSSVSFVNIRR